MELESLPLHIIIICLEGIVASILVGFGTAIKLVKPEIKLALVGALFAIVFEMIIGGWLIYYSII